MITVGAATTGALAAAPAITTHPANATVKVGTPATFNVVASGTAPLTYKWYKNGAWSAPKPLQSTQRPQPLDADNNAAFTVVVSNSAGSTPPSAPASLTVVDIIIGLQPASQTVTTPGVAQFNASAYPPRGHSHLPVV